MIQNILRAACLPLLFTLSFLPEIANIPCLHFVVLGATELSPSVGKFLCLSLVWQIPLFTSPCPRWVYHCPLNLEWLVYGLVSWAVLGCEVLCRQDHSWLHLHACWLTLPLTSLSIILLKVTTAKANIKQK